jgi:F420-dependent oxidoreductase-like protein
MTKLGYQIPNFTYAGVGPADLFEAVAAQAEAADRSGFDTVLVMDHFYQLPMLGPPENYMIEAYTLLGALAQRTENVRLGTLVTGNTYRNPALLAKIITALDIVSGGRAQLGIGSGWFEEEHDSLGFEFGTFTDRFERLEEALQIILPLLNGERVTLDGDRYQVKDAHNEPPPVGAIPVMIGGSGEKKTLRMSPSTPTSPTSPATRPRSPASSTPWPRTASASVATAARSPCPPPATCASRRPTTRPWPRSRSSSASGASTSTPSTTTPAPCSSR